jgi:glycosyltransferase involved in cell wall biosynthesis
MNQSTLVSVIVLAYNVGKFIEECLQSIISQSYVNLDIIVVINGKSPDDTEEISKKFARKDKRIRLIYNDKNSYLEIGRKLGLDAVKGEYFTLIDGDDCLPDDSIENLVKLIKSENADIATGLVEKFDKKIKFVQTPQNITDILKNSRNKYLPYSLLYMDFFLHGKLYKTSLYRDNPIELLKLRFPIAGESSVGDDAILHFQLSYYANKIVRENRVVHFFRNNSNSVTHNIKYKGFAGRFAAQMWLESFFKEKGLLEQPEIYIAFQSYSYVKLYYLLSSGGLQAFKDFPQDVNRLLYSNDLQRKEIKDYLKQWKLFYIVLVLFRTNKYLGDILGHRLLNYLRKIVKKYGK